MNELAEVVWTEHVSDSHFNIVSNSRGVIAGGTGTRRDPDINNQGEIIWHFGDGGAGPNGIESNLRGTILNSLIIDDGPRINASGEIVATRGGSPGEALWSNQRGYLTVPGSIARWPELNDAGEVVYATQDFSFIPPYRIRSTVQGEVAGSSFGAYHPEINSLGEIVWQQAAGPFGGAPGTSEIWSNRRGKLGDGEYPSINDSGEVVWQYWDGTDFEMYSSVRGQLTSNLKMDTEPYINNMGDVAWLRSVEDRVPEPSAITLATIWTLLAWGAAKHRVCQR